MLTVLAPGLTPGRLSWTLDAILTGRPARVLSRLEGPLHRERVLFAVALDPGGVNLECAALLSFLRTHPGCLEGCVGGVVVDGPGDLYTKALGRDIVLAASLAGCIFPGRPLVEATGGLQNFTVQAKNAGCSPAQAYQLAAGDLAERILRFAPPRHPPLVEATGGLQNFTVQAKNAGCSPAQAYQLAAGDLAERILRFAPPRHPRPRVLVLHASSHATSNTLALWSHVRAGLEDRCILTEIGLRNGTLEDCAGCPYTMCLHFGEQEDCFYGGVMVQEVYPAIRASDAVVLLCPNYNDALSANLTAAINRLTALYRSAPFTDTAVFAIVVSGYSGGDIVASNYNDALSANLTAAINRLTALYRSAPFTDTAVFAIVVSGYSGGDIVASQVVSAMSMNKGFWLPARFCMLETANDAGDALALPGIETRLAAFTETIRSQLLR